MSEAFFIKDFKYILLAFFAIFLVNSVFDDQEFPSQTSSQYNITFNVVNFTFFQSKEYNMYQINKDNYSFHQLPKQKCYFSGYFDNRFFKNLGGGGYHWYFGSDPKRCASKHRLFVKNNQKQNPEVTYYDEENVAKINFESLLYKGTYHGDPTKSANGTKTISLMEKPQKAHFLCQIKISSSCKTHFIAESIDLLYTVIPIYSIDQDRLRDIYIMHEHFKHYLQSIGIPWVVIEATYDGQDFIVSDPDKEQMYIQLKIKDKFYYRENFVNVAAKKNKNWEYLMWIDAHQIFLNTYWWEEAIYKLEKFATLQMFDELNHFTECNNSFYQNGYAFQNLKRYRKKMITFPDYYGNAWGMRREIYESIDHILDECIASGCDTGLNFATFKDEGEWNHWTYYPYYLAQLSPWFKQARAVLGGNSNVLRGELLHFFHEHFYDYEYYLSCFSMGGYNLSTDIARDENFLLYSKSEKISYIFERDE